MLESIQNKSVEEKIPKTDLDVQSQASIEMSILNQPMSIKRISADQS